MKPEIVDSSSRDWREFEDAPGVRYKVLRHHEGRRGLTLLLQFDAGASYPAHRHPQGEEYFVLEGTVEDGGRTYGAQTYVFHAPGSVHRPSSPGGCTLLVTLPAHIERTDV
ncbi:MAG TPA: cupin domain-containing protein [Candidatus Krumholzibacteria bacterium]|nr:cupin domain-containing protein [Candidatus Krumholzibacteria bacterium]